MSKTLKELKEFMFRGNVVDLAVAVVIGGAFGKIVSSLVADLIMPPIGYLLGGVNFTELKCVLKEAGVDAAGKAIPAVTINYGAFLQTVFDFVIIATAIFFVVKAISKLQKKKEEAPAAPAAPTKDQELLMEIRDLLKDKK